MALQIIKLTFISVLAILAACGTVPETRYYTIELNQLSEQPHRIGQFLHVQKFDASPVLKYDKLMYKSSLYEIKYDAYRRWAAAPNILISEKAVEYFAESGLFDNVVTEIPPSRNGYSLFGYISHFEESVKAGKRIALVSINFDIFALHDRSLLLHKNIKQTAAIEDETIDGIMAAMSRATQSVFENLAKEFISLSE